MRKFISSFGGFSVKAFTNRDFVGVRIWLTPPLPDPPYRHLAPRSLTHHQTKVAARLCFISRRAHPHVASSCVVRITGMAFGRIGSPFRLQTASGLRPRPLPSVAQIATALSEKSDGAPDTIRTCDLCLLRGSGQPASPAEESPCCRSADDLLVMARVRVAFISGGKAQRIIKAAACNGRA
jgi:hypothetical protein